MCLSWNAWDNMDTLQMSHSSGSLTSHWIWRAIPNYFDCLQLLFVTAVLSTFLDWNHLDFFIIIITKVNISLFTSWWHSEIRQENLKINIGISITLYTRRKVAKIEDIWSFLLFKLLSISWRDGKDTRALLFWHARSHVCYQPYIVYITTFSKGEKMHLTAMCRNKPHIISIKNRSISCQYSKLCKIHIILMEQNIE